MMDQNKIYFSRLSNPDEFPDNSIDFKTPQDADKAAKLYTYLFEQNERLRKALEVAKEAFKMTFFKLDPFGLAPDERKKDS